MLNQLRVFTLVILLTMLSACAAPGLTPSDLPAALPPTQPSTIVTASPGPSPQPTPALIPEETPFPSLDLPQEDRGLNFGLPAWQQVEAAIAAEFSAHFNMGAYLCEWEFLGRDEQKVFIRYGCEFDHGNGARGAGPGIIYLKGPGSIDHIFIPKVSETEWDANPDVPARIHEAYRQPGEDLMSRLVLRRAHPELPPAAAVKAGFEPRQPLSEPPVFAPGEEPRWRAIERALASEWYGTDADILCEWRMMGQLEGKTYLAPICEPVDRNKRVFRIPYCILDENQDGVLQANCYQAVDLNGAYTLDPAVFPAPVREKYLAVSSQNAMPLLDHLELRRWYPDLPPLAAAELQP